MRRTRGTIGRRTTGAAVPPSDGGSGIADEGSESGGCGSPESAAAADSVGADDACFSIPVSVIASNTTSNLLLTVTLNSSVRFESKQIEIRIGYVIH
ncbi:hypothetical protein BHM03_00050468, partial [Ensete ventricosum]